MRDAAIAVIVERRRKLCECGCGLPTSLAKQSETATGYVKGQSRRFIAGHNQRLATRAAGEYKAVAGVRRDGLAGTVRAHVAVAEKALGKCLPEGACVHHVDGNKQNNQPSNLVICQDEAYHKLLHFRAMVVRAGGNPNLDGWCYSCSRVKPIDDFNRRRSNKSTGRQSECRDCHNARVQTWRAVMAERRRNIGLVLAAVGRLRLAGQLDAAKVVDEVALAIEHPQAPAVQLEEATQ